MRNALLRGEALTTLAATAWQHPLGVEPRKSREQASASRPPMDRAGSDPAPAAR